METASERRLRARAPLEAVWAESATLERLLVHPPEIVRFEVAPGGDHAALEVRLAWGRFDWNLDGTARRTGCVTHEGVSVEVELPGLNLAFQAKVELSAAAEGETNVTYRGRLASENPLVNRLAAAFKGITEFHVRSTVENLAAAAERRFQAEEQLLRRFGAGR